MVVYQRGRVNLPGEKVKGGVVVLVMPGPEQILAMYLSYYCLKLAL